MFQGVLRDDERRREKMRLKQWSGKRKGRNASLYMQIGRVYMALSVLVPFHVLSSVFVTSPGVPLPMSWSHLHLPTSLSVPSPSIRPRKHLRREKVTPKMEPRPWTGKPKSGKNDKEEWVQELCGGRAALGW